MFKYLKTFEKYISTLDSYKVLFISNNLHVQYKQPSTTSIKKSTKQEKGKDIDKFFIGQMRYFILNEIWSGLIGLNTLTTEQIQNIYFPQNTIVYCYDVIDVYASKEKQKTARYNTIQQLTKSMKKLNGVQFYINKAIVSSKVETQKLLGNEEYFIKAVFDPRDIEKSIGFPVVAKPSFGHSGKGIQKFNTTKQLSQYIKTHGKEVFDLYTEYVDYSREFRSMYVDGKLFYLSERIPVKSTNVDINNKSADTEMDFVYVVQDIPKLPFLNELNNINKSIYSKIPLHVYSIDFFLTKENSIKVIEVNTQSGLDPYRLISLYEFLYAKHADIPIADSQMNLCIDTKNIFLENQHSFFKEEIKTSYMPIKYNGYSINSELYQSIQNSPSLTII